MTNSKLKSWLISGLRRMTMRFPPRNEALKAAKVGKKLNPKTGRMCDHYKCAGCLNEFPGKEIAMDHIQPIVEPGVGFVNWDVYMQRMWVPVEQWQPLCKECHTKKSSLERQERRAK